MATAHARHILVDTKELCDDLKTQIESLLSVGFDEEARLSKFRSFDIPQRVAHDYRNLKRSGLC